MVEEALRTLTSAEQRHQKAQATQSQHAGQPKPATESSTAEQLAALILDDERDVKDKKQDDAFKEKMAKLKKLASALSDVEFTDDEQKEIMDFDTPFLIWSLLSILLLCDLVHLAKL